MIRWIFTVEKMLLAKKANHIITCSKNTDFSRSEQNWSCFRILRFCCGKNGNKEHRSRKNLFVENNLLTSLYLQAPAKVVCTVFWKNGRTTAINGKDDAQKQD